MATKKIRVYELARELGVENHVVLELCEELKIGVKSHSSSIDDPSADRARRRADELGLRRDPIVEAKPEAAKPKTGPAKEAAPVRTSRVVRSGGAVAAPTPLIETPAAAVPSVTSAKEVAPPVAASVGTPSAPTEVVDTPDSASPGAPKTQEDSAPSAPAALRSVSGKPIPPPPGAGRRIPPPPSAGRTASGGGAPGGSRGGATGGPRSGGAGASGAPGGYRGGPGSSTGAPGGAPGAGRGAPGGGPGGPNAPGGAPGGFAGRGGGRPGGGPGGGPGQRPRRKKRRRRVIEDLGPASAPSLTPNDAPVPEGEIVVPRGITIQEFAPRLNRTSADLVRILFDAGEMVTGTQSLVDEMIELIAEHLGAEVLLVEPGQEAERELQELFLEDDDEDDVDLPPRAPIVTVMGHVDHGKTTLLDRIRSANVVAGEAGGITQHIGAYQAFYGDTPITFIDTPGHEAFTAMRKRGALATDVAVLVVAGDDGVMPQTIEAINHARAAEVPIVVAITKIDRPDADPMRVKQQLVEQGLVPEEWGGDTVVNEVAAMEGLGVDELLESILLVAELYDPPLGADPNAPARAFVLESNLDQGRGPVVTALIERGTLRVGDPIVAGGGWGKVRAMFNHKGESVKEAGPSTPVEVLGLDALPLAGDELRVAPNDKVARTVAEARARRRRASNMTHPTILAGGARLEDIFAMVERGETATLNLVLKADVQGSLEALTDALRKLDQEHEEVRLSFVHRAVGGISESDINLAAVSNASVIGFNVRPDRKARALAEQEKVEMRLYEVIYQILDDVNKALLGLLKPEFEEIVTGDAEVREIFSVPRIGKIAGCFVRNGVITRGSQVRFLREGTIIWKGSIASLRRFKEDAREVRDGFECGIGLENFQDLKPGDIIETFELKEIARTS